jgi:hypothetical protein
VGNQVFCWDHRIFFQGAGGTPRHKKPEKLATISKDADTKQPSKKRRRGVDIDEAKAVVLGLLHSMTPK